ncbi:MAG: manganese transporter, partial [Marinomonas sp.]
MSNKRAIVPLLVGCLWLVPGLQSTISSVLSEAFIQVSAFVAATLAIYYGISHHLNTLGLQKWINNKPYREVLFASLMGVLPGCGGAIVIITQYTKGQIRFGAVVAVLTSTMGDAAFLLVSQRPQDALIVLPLCMAVGVISGLFTNRFLPSPALAIPSTNEQNGDTTATSKPSLHTIDILIAKLSIVFWCVLIVPMTAVALLVAMQYDVNGLIGLPEHSIETLGAMAGFSCLLL